MQLDGGENSEQKFAKMASQGTLFVDPETLDDDDDGELRPAKCLQTRANASPPPGAATAVRSKANILIRVAHGAFEMLCAAAPALRTLVLAYIFPFYAYYLAA